MDMSLISTIFTVAMVLIGGVCIMLFVSTKTLRDSRDDQEHRIKQLEEERIRDKKLIGEQEAAIRFWRGAATGDEKLDKITELVIAISTLLDRHHGDATKEWLLVNAGLGHLGETFDHMSEAIDHLVEYLETADDK